MLSLASVQINKPITNIALGIVLFCALFAANARTRFRIAISHPVVQGCLVWLTVLCASGLYAWQQGNEITVFASYTLALLYPLLFSSLINSEKKRVQILLGFCLPIGAMVCVTWLQYIQIIPQRTGTPNARFGYTLFKEYTQQGLAFLIFASLMFAVLSSSNNKKVKLISAIFLFATLTSVILLMQSRTAYLTLVPLLFYWIFIILKNIWKIKFGWKSGFISAFAVAGVLSILLSTDMMQQRLVGTVSNEISRYLDHRQATETGIRIELWKQTISIINKAPILGHGFRQWHTEFTQQTKNFPDYTAFKMGHPHNEGLLILTEQGVIGFVIWLLLLTGLAKFILKLRSPYKEFFASVLIIYFTASLANCLWADFTHRHTFILLLSCIPLIPTSNKSNINA
jgi:O-antigen ligase